MTRMRAAGKLVAFDNNYRPRLWESATEARVEPDTPLESATEMSVITLVATESATEMAPAEASALLVALEILVERRNVAIG